MPAIERNPYDLSHFVHTCGKIGRLQTLSIIPTLPGDSFEIKIDGIIRLAPLRKEVVQESQVDVCVFWVPDRHIYPEWPTIVQEGVDGSGLASLPTLSLPVDARNACYLLEPFAPASLPARLNRGYNRIWDQYFRVPSLPRDTDDTTYPSTQTPDDIDWRLYGRRCSRLNHPTNLGLKTATGTPRQPWRDMSAADFTVEAPVSGANALLDLRALEQIKGRYRSELERTWMSDRYRDILGRQWGSSVNIDADQRPELVWRETFALGGHDVDGTADATLGQYTGKTIGGVVVDVPRKYFPEHGMLWVLALVRWPVIHVGERHPLNKISAWTARELLGDPDVYIAQPPKPVDFTDWLAAPYGIAGTDADLQEPFGNYYRVHPNTVHRNFADIPGYPLVDYNFSTAFYQAAFYHAAGEYDDVFQTSQLAHWQIHAKTQVTALRYVPDPLNNIYAGADR